MPQNELYMTVATIVIVSGLVFLILAKPMNKLAHGVK